MVLQTMPLVRDPHGWFRTYNRRLVELMVRVPRLALIVRQIGNAMTIWAEERGIPLERVDADTTLRNDGRIIIVLKEKATT